MEVNENQYEMGVLSAKWLLKEMGKTEGTILEVRGLPGNSVDRDRHDGFQATMKASGGKWNIIEVVGNWDDGTAQKATADALAVHGHFDGLFTQGGTTGSVRALMDAKHPFIPIAGEGENGFRKLVAEHAKDGLKGFSYGQSPALVAISIKAAIAALEGEKMPQMISVPIPMADYTDLKDGVNYWSDLTDNFFRRQRVRALWRRTSRRLRSWRRTPRTFSSERTGPGTCPALLFPRSTGNERWPSGPPGCPFSSCGASASATAACGPSRRSTSPASPARSMPCSARTVPASRR